MLKKIRPAETYGNYVKVLTITANIIGVNVLVPKYANNFRVKVAIGFIVMFFMFSLNTLRTMKSNDWTVLIGIICTLGPAVSGATKMFSAITKARQYYEMSETMIDIFKKYQEIGHRYEEVLANGCKRLSAAFRLVGAVYAQMVIFSVVLPLFVMFFSGQRYTIIFCQLPGFDLNTDFGYWLTYIFHIFCVIIAGCGLFAGDIFVIMCLINSLLYVDLIRIMIEDINEEIDRKSDSKSNDKKITTILHDIVAWHQSYFIFTDKCNDIFFWPITVQISFSCISIVLTLYIIIFLKWPGAYAYIIYGFNSLYEYFILGTNVDICNDELCVEIYNIHWYSLNLSQQKTVRLMLMRSQSPRTINVAGVMPMTVSTALSITRTIYSSFMMLLQFR